PFSLSRAERGRLGPRVLGAALLLSGQPREIRADQVVDQPAGGLRAHHRELVGRGQRGDAVHARPQRARRAPAFVLAARREIGGQRTLDLRRQPLELLLVPCRQLGAARHVVLEQKVPQARLLLREGQIGTGDADQSVVGPCARAKSHTWFHTWSL